MKASNIEEVFLKCKRENRCAFIPFVTSGDPDLDMTFEICVRMAEKGADIIELGMPFSDPLADGPTIQAASQRALEGGVNTEKVLRLVERITAQVDTPIVLMGYYNPILQYGLESFARDAHHAGAAGTIVPDLPLEEAGPWMECAKGTGLDNILLVAPNTPLERVKKIAKRSKGFLYYVSVTGITGARTQLPPELAQGLRSVRSVSPVPVAVGFGISRPEQVRALSPEADGIIVGSAIVRIIEDHAKSPSVLMDRIGEFVASMSEATKRKC